MSTLLKDNVAVITKKQGESLALERGDESDSLVHQPRPPARSDILSNLYSYYQVAEAACRPANRTISGFPNSTQKAPLFTVELGVQSVRSTSESHDGIGVTAGWHSQ